MEVHTPVSRRSIWILVILGILLAVPLVLFFAVLPFDRQVWGVVERGTLTRGTSALLASGIFLLLAAAVVLLAWLMRNAGTRATRP